MILGVEAKKDTGGELQDVPSLKVWFHMFNEATRNMHLENTEYILTHKIHVWYELTSTFIGWFFCVNNTRMGIWLFW